MIIKELEDFIDRVCFSIICEEEFYDIVVKSGINVLKFPKTSAGVVEEAKRFFKESNYKIAKEKNKKLVHGLLQYYDEPDLPRDAESLKLMFRELYTKNNIYKKALELVKASETESLKELTKKISEFRDFHSSEVVAGEITALYDTYIHAHNALIRQGSVLTKIPNFNLLSQMIGGFNESRIGILLGASGLGKSNLSLTLALNARKIMNVCYINLEMDFLDITRRAMVLESGIHYKTFFSEEVPIDEMLDGMKKTKLKKMFVTNGRKLSIEQIKSWVRKQNKEHDIKFLVIDYDQKIDLGLDTKLPEWKLIQNALEDLEDFAKEINAYILMVAQVNQEGKISSSKRATHSAHSVLSFHNHNRHGYVIEAVKNRHGMKDQALKVFYNQLNSKITEHEIINIKEQDAKERL